MPGPTRLVLYGRRWCHLCHEMQAELEALQSRYRFELEVIDVDADSELEERLGELIPVLEHDGEELARYRLDADVFTARLSRKVSYSG